MAILFAKKMHGKFVLVANDRLVMQKPIRIVCPFCKTRGIIPRDLLAIPSKNDDLRVTNNFVPKGVVCEHAFVVYVDTQGVIRGRDIIHNQDD